MKKSFICLLLAIISCMSISCCYAATALKDVKGTKYEEAVNNLVDFGIVTGFEDNTYKPSNNVTRAQLSKMLILSLGKEDEVEAASKKFLDFSDVLSTHWGYGYIKLASDNKVISGYSNGTFKPDGNVTYAEATTMIVRALGYEDAVSQSKLSWPDNYMTYADEKLKLFKNVPTFKANSPANRGDIALLIWNALRTGVAEVTSYNSNGLVYTQGTPMITEYLGCIYLNNAEITKVVFDDDFREATVTFKEENKNSVSYDFEAEDVLNMYGCKITLLYDKKKNEIKSLEKESEYKEIKSEVTRISDSKIYVSSRTTGYKLPDEDNILLYGIDDLSDAINVILYVDGTNVEYMVASGADKVAVGLVIDDNIKVDDDEYGIRVRDVDVSKGGEKYLLADEENWPEEYDVILYYVNEDDLLIIFDNVSSEDAKTISDIEDDYIKVGKKYYEFDDKDDYTVIFASGSKLRTEDIDEIDEDEDAICVMEYNAHLYFIVFEDAIRDSIDDEILAAYDELQYAIEEALDLDEEEWTQKSFAVLMDEVRKGKELTYTDTLSKLTKATSRIEEAMDIMVKAKSSEVKTLKAKKELRALVNEDAEEIIENEDEYTTKSYNIFEKAYDDAVDVLLMSNATRDEINDAYDELYDAIENLDKKK